MWQPWANDAESFERSVLADLERRITRPVATYLMREPARRRFRGARLDGSYPKTAIVVSFLNLQTGTVDESRFPLWEEEGYRSGGGVIDPESIAADIWTYLIEPASVPPYPRVTNRWWPELWKPWANGPESFERAVLVELEQSVGGHTPELMREPAGREFRGARLEGSYPNTEIVVDYLDLNAGNVVETRFPVWKEGPRIRKENYDPQSVAQGIWLWLIEPL
jgi:hypothetical protein